MIGRYICIITVYFSFLLWPGCVLVGQAAEPEQFVRDFYAWYFEADKGRQTAEMNDAIYMFVDAATVKSIRSNENALYYFTKVGTYSSAWEKVQVIVRRAVPVGESAYVVPVNFELAHKTVYVVVVVRFSDGKPRITKVMDAYPYIGGE